MDSVPLNASGVWVSFFSFLREVSFLIFIFFLTCRKHNKFFFVFCDCESQSEVIFARELLWRVKPDRSGSWPTGTETRTDRNRDQNRSEQRPGQTGTRPEQTGVENRTDRSQSYVGDWANKRFAVFIQDMKNEKKKKKKKKSTNLNGWIVRSAADIQPIADVDRIRWQ